MCTTVICRLTHLPASGSPGNPKSVKLVGTSRNDHHSNRSPARSNKQSPNSNEPADVSWCFIFWDSHSVFTSIFSDDLRTCGEKACRAIWATMGVPQQELLGFQTWSTLSGDGLPLLNGVSFRHWFFQCWCCIMWRLQVVEGRQGSEGIGDVEHHAITGEAVASSVQSSVRVSPQPLQKAPQELMLMANHWSLLCWWRMMVFNDSFEWWWFTMMVMNDDGLQC